MQKTTNIDDVLELEADLEEWEGAELTEQLLQPATARALPAESCTQWWHPRIPLTVPELFQWELLQALHCSLFVVHAVFCFDPGIFDNAYKLALPTRLSVFMIHSRMLLRVDVEMKFMWLI